MRITRNLIIIISVIVSVFTLNAQNTTNYAIIRVDPLKSRVMIDSVEIAVNDGIASCLLSEGKHFYNVSCHDFETEEGSFTVVANKRTEITVKLRSKNAHLSVISETSGATLYIDGEQVEGSNWSGYVSPGLHVIKSVMKGFQSYETKVSLERGMIREISIPSLVKAKGSVNVNFLPFDAEVYIDDNKMGLSPLVINNLDEGKHSLLVKKGNHHPLNTDFYIIENKMTNIDGTLVAYEAVDLGLSVDWASSNLGTSVSEQQGDSYCWGAPNPSWDKSPGYETNSFGLSCLMANESVWRCNKTYDAVREQWGESWRMPTHQEMQELISQCRWIRTQMNGERVVKIIGPNGNSIILPYGEYWAGDRNPAWGIYCMKAYSLQITFLPNEEYTLVSCGPVHGKIYDDESRNYHSLGYDDCNQERAMWRKLLIRPVRDIKK